MNHKNLLHVLFILCVTMFYISCGSDDPEIPTPNPPDPPVEESSEKTITAFSFPATPNGLKAEIKGKISGTTIKLETKDWIDNIESLIPTFQGVGTVKIGDTEQVSGTTANDFRKEVTYTVIAEDKSEIDYKVILKCPQSTGLPVIKIDTENGKPITDKENYITANIKVIDIENDENNLEKETGIRGRGNSTWGYPKKPYRLKFDKKTSLFGLGKAKSWVLLANYQDPTLIMNSVAFELGHRFGLQYTNHVNHVELFLNGTYQGSYMLTEQVQINEFRVNIDEDTGLLLELDTYYEEYQFKTDRINLTVTVKNPETTEGVAEAKRVMKDLEDALFDSRKDFPNNNYKDMIDINSLINFLLVNEITRNSELQHPKSMFMYKEVDGKIQMGPLWDFDWGFGYRGSGFNYFANTTNMLLKPNYTGNLTGYKFFCRFFDDPEFRKAYKARWNELYTSKIANIDTYIDDMAALLQKSQTENFEIWKNNLDYNNQISSMKDWIKTRIESLNTAINQY